MHVHVVHISITVIKWLENHLNVFKRSNDPWNFPNIHMIVVLVHATRRKILKAVRGRYLPFVIKHALFPLGTASLLVSYSSLWGGCLSKVLSNMPIFLPHHLGVMTLHQVRFHVFLIIFYFFGIKMPWHSMNMSMPWDQYVWKFLLIYCTWN